MMLHVPDSLGWLCCAVTLMMPLPLAVADSVMVEWRLSLCTRSYRGQHLNILSLA